MIFDNDNNEVRKKYNVSHPFGNGGKSFFVQIKNDKSFFKN